MLNVFPHLGWHMIKRWKLLIGMSLLLLCTLTALLVITSQEPTPAVAYSWIFDEDPPSFVSSLASKYSTHLKGYSIYLTFTVPPEKLPLILDTDVSAALYLPELDYLDDWHQEDQFRMMLPEHPPDVMSCRKIERIDGGTKSTIVYNPSNGAVYCYYVRDSDIDS